MHFERFESKKVLKNREIALNNLDILISHSEQDIMLIIQDQIKQYV